MNTIAVKRQAEDRAVYSSLETYSIETNETVRLKEFDYLIEAPEWSADGVEMIYNARGRLHAYQIQQGTVREIPSGFCTQCNNDHVKCADGKSIGISHHTAEDGQSRIYRIDRDGKAPVLITPMAPSYLHGWSPDGTTLSYCAERNGQFDVYTIPAWGGEEKQITNEPGLDDGPEFSPDGRKIWFNSTRSGLMQIYCMNVDGSDIRQMTNEASNNWFAHVSPDGKWVVYIAYGKRDVAPDEHPANKNVEIRMIPACGGVSRTLVQLFGGQGTMNVNSWSPDSRQFAYVRYRNR